MENKIRHLELIQNVVSRMSSNSFMLKGWAVTLIVGIFVLADKDTDKLYFLIAYIPTIVFGGLDTYYLLQERLYRSLFDKVRHMDENNIDFSLNVTSLEFKSCKNTFWNCFFSKTELCFYLPLTLVYTVVMIVTHM